MCHPHGDLMRHAVWWMETRQPSRPCSGAGTAALVDGAVAAVAKRGRPAWLRYWQGVECRRRITTRGPAT